MSPVRFVPDGGMRKPKLGLTWTERALLRLMSLRRGACRRLRERWNAEYAIFSDHFAVPVWKFLALERCRADVSTLVLGSSHAYYGYFAEQDEFNLADVSCDFHLASALLGYWLSRGLPALRRVVLFYDDFGPGNVLEKSSEVYRMIPYVRLYGMEIGSHRSDTNLYLSYDDLCAAFDRGMRRFRPIVDDGYRGNFGYGFRPYKSPQGILEKRVRGHLKLNSGEECVHIARMIADLKPLGIRLTLVMPPLREDYRSLLPKDRGVLFRALWRTGISPQDIEFVDLLDSSLFTSGDFNDMDHLNENGARKLSACVRTSANKGGVHA